MLTGCNPSIKQSTLQISPLDESLARPCKQLSKPADNYDDWQRWFVEEVLVVYTECGIDKNKIVQEWNKIVEKNKQLQQTK